jgi:hypothetical protein
MPWAHPILLPPRFGGSGMAVYDAPSGLVEPSRHVPSAASRAGAHHASAPAFPCTQALCRPDAQAPLCVV